MLECICIVLVLCLDMDVDDWCDDDLVLYLVCIMEVM